MKIKKSLPRTHITVTSKSEVGENLLHGKLLRKGFEKANP